MSASYGRTETRPPSAARYQTFAPGPLGAQTLEEALAPIITGERRVISLTDRRHGGAVIIETDPRDSTVTIRHAAHRPISERERDSMFAGANALETLKTRAHAPGADPKEIWDAANGAPLERIAAYARTLRKRDDDALTNMKSLARKVRRLTGRRCAVSAPGPIPKSVERAAAANGPDELERALRTAPDIAA